MEILAKVGMFLWNTSGGMVLGALGAFSLWRLADWLWDKLRPIKPAVDFMKKKANETGLNTKAFLDSRIKDEALRAKMIKELQDGSETIQDAFVLGLSGTTIQ